MEAREWARQPESHSLLELPDGRGHEGVRELPPDEASDPQKRCALRDARASSQCDRC